MGFLRSCSDDPSISHRPREVPVAVRRACLHLASWWIHFDLRSLPATESESRWRNYRCGLPRSRKLIGERLHPNVRSLCAVSRLPNRRAESHRSHRLHPSHFAENLYIWWVRVSHILISVVRFRSSSCSPHFCDFLIALLPNLLRLMPGSSNLETMFLWFRSAYIVTSDRYKQRHAIKSITFGVNGIKDNFFFWDFAKNFSGLRNDVKIAFLYYDNLHKKQMRHLLKFLPTSLLFISF